ncbi:MAG TPA: WXG100 family type VII secretion target [Ilumatobacteraceae bacterium]|nr:WXG100 family type VII secretion target [Ilumatobacteraceae bacterium]
MTMYGANPEQLTTLGTTLTRQIDTIAQLMSTVDGVLNGTTWQGPARERFVEDWNGSFKQALNRLNDAFGLAGRDCVARSEELRRIMGAGV